MSPLKFLHIIAIMICIWSVIPGCGPTTGIRPIARVRINAGAHVSVQHVQISPNGRRVVYTIDQSVKSGKQRSSVTHIYMANTDGSSVRQVTSGEKSSTRPQWSPDGQWIAFISKYQEMATLSLMRSNGDDIRPLTRPLHKIVGFKWSPDGGQIAYVHPKPTMPPAGGPKKISNQSRMNQLWGVSVDTNTDTLPPSRALTDDSLHVVFSDLVTAFDWSPDGTHIAFVHRPETENWLLSDISTVDVSTGIITPLANTGAAEITPFYSPDGRSIAYAVNRPTLHQDISFEIYLVTATGGPPRKLAATPDEWPTILGWDRDSRHIYFTEQYNRTPHLSVLPIDGTQSRPVHRNRVGRQPSFQNAGTMVGFKSSVISGQFFEIHVMPWNAVKATGLPSKIPFRDNHYKW